ncbi:MAG: sulfite exporter TauE/SafE family protein [Chitinophagales bacterium]|nr:sulfite exporter TauE/SafE family protein [Chitinophagales bacterium]MDW8392870.1 sulfite exporter TauE/SafE family protein [Chitinophagales bacterium]
MLRDIQPAFLLLTFLAEVTGTVGGFGSSVFFVPVAALYLSMYSALGLTALFHLFSNLSKLLLFRSGLQRHLLLYLGVPAVVMVLAGSLLAGRLPEALLQRFLGVFLVLSSLLLLWRQTSISPQSQAATIFGGALSGLAAGLLGTGGAIRGITMASFNLEKSAFVATSAFIDLCVDATRTVVYYRNGFIQKDLLIYVPFLLLIALLGTWAGQRILRHVPQTRFRQLSLLLVLAIGVFTLWNSF